MLKNLARIIAGIASSIIIMGLLFYFFLFSNPLAIYEVNMLKWVPIFICIIALLVSGWINRKTPAKLLPLLFIPFVIFHLFNFAYFPFILILVLVGILTLIITRDHLSKRYKRLSIAGVAVIFGYFLFSQALILQKENFGYDDSGDLVNANVIWDFTEEEILQIESHIFLDSNNQEIDMIEFRDKTHFVTFWATWCAPCIKEKPELYKLKQYFRNSSEVAFVDVSFDQDKLKWQKFLDTNEVAGMQLISQDSKETSRELNFEGIPMHIIINPDRSYKKYKSLDVARKVLTNSYEESKE
ncbi:TlpA family protein disulfide reductase [Marivirga sp. S37H4]|uniref:TlpA family protein disulfide reductase n=1 Tax=Marivirga aurantiaca TaxID=2802615 RepID=A0A935C9L0_9BACT|nr:TlpA disulfide reductase family protein [Marivirga aurantiaca]MBK6265662.1 TlpA family protein disulfide reductase [Marivirga aurantiaca]